MPIESLQAFLDDHMLDRLSIFVWIGLVDDARRNIHLHPTEGIDDVYETLEADHCVIVDLQLEEIPDRCLDGSRTWFPWTRKGFRVLLGVVKEIVQKPREALAFPVAEARGQIDGGEIAGQ